MAVTSVVVAFHASPPVASSEGWELVCGELVEVVVVAVVEVVVGVEVAVTGVVVAVVGVEVAVTGIVITVVVVEVAIIGVEVAVGVMVKGVEVAMGSRTVSSGIVGVPFDIRCLLSHSATAVTPSCHES